ncbi:recombinase family protein, partial [Klebsiella pneumoniae]|nr:recombinase family protein [Klebsiella pneumoniae]
SVLKISRELNRLGVTTRTGGRWADSAVKYLLKNPLHKGLYTFGKARKGRGDGRDLVTCEVPAIVTPQQWDAVQRSLAQRSTGGRPNTVDL